MKKKKMTDHEHMIALLEAVDKRADFIKAALSHPEMHDKIVEMADEIKRIASIKDSLRQGPGQIKIVHPKGSKKKAKFFDPGWAKEILSEADFKELEK